MADDSKRERIIKRVEELVQSVEMIKTVKRIMPSLEDLENYANTQLPLAAIVGQLPVPQAKVKGRGPGATRDYFRSMLRVNVYVYFMDNEAPDATLSFLLDELWRILYADQQLQSEQATGLAYGIELRPEMEPEVYYPYYAFLLSVDVTYFHQIEGI